MTEPRLTATVAELEVFRHSRSNCRHCDHEFESSCCSILAYCPVCGCPVREPENPPPADEGASVLRGEPIPR